MRSIAFNNRSFEEYEKLRKKNHVLLKKVVKMLVSMQRGDPMYGIGKPELLKGEYAGLWSRKITAKDRLIYRFDDEIIYIFAIGGHYNDR